MKKILLAALVALVGLLMVSPPAAAVPKEAQGCPASASVWTQVQYVSDPYTEDYEATSFYDYYWSLTTDEGVNVVDFWKATYGPQWTDPEIYGALAQVFDNRPDRNGDHSVCLSWIGEHYIGLKHLDMTYISIVDNNANANH